MGGKIFVSVWLFRKITFPDCASNLPGSSFTRTWCCIPRNYSLGRRLPQAKTLTGLDLRVHINIPEKRIDRCERSRCGRAVRDRSEHEKGFIGEAGWKAIRHVVG